MTNVQRCWALVVCLLLAGLTVVTATVHSLNDDNFDAFVNSLPDEKILLVDFYKPACGHCQRLNAVIDYLDKLWEEEEEEDPSKRWFELAKVDASRSQRLAMVFGLSRFPDLRFVRAGQWTTYEGKTAIEDIQVFKQRMAIIPLPALDAKKLQELVVTDEVVFVLATETGTDPASESPVVALAATMLQHLMTFGTIAGEDVSCLGLDGKSLPALIKVVAGPDGLRSLAFDEDLQGASYLALTRWLERQNHRLMVEIGPETFSRVGRLGKLVVAGIVDPAAEETPDFTRALTTVASGMGMKHADKLVFGTLNGITLTSFAESLNVFDGLPRLVVMDVPRDSFYSAPVNPRMGVVEIEAFLVSVLAGDVALTKSSSEKVRLFMKLWWIIRNGGRWSLLLIFPIIGLLWVIVDTPDWQEQREAVRKAKREEREAKAKAAARLKQD